MDFINVAMSGAELKNAVTGIMAVTLKGDTLACVNPSTMMLPASNMKLVTTGLAMNALGSGYRWETRIGHDGKIVDGVLKGNLYIIGGGDPTTGSRDSIAVPVTRTFDEWAGIVADAGIRQIDGYVIGDDRYFSGMPEHESWQYNDIGTYYGSGVSGLSFFENCQTFRVAPGDRPGSPLNIRPEYPETPWMQIRYDCTTGKPGTGNSLYFYPSDLAPKGVMRGSFAVDRKPKTEKASNKFPAYTCAYHFVRHLETKGTVCRYGAADTGDVFVPKRSSGSGFSGIAPRDSLVILGSTLSPELKRVVSETNHDSNNFYAEALFKTLGKEYCGEGCFDSARVAVSGLLCEMQIYDKSVRITDGSGLSRLNYMSAGWLCGFLEAMAGQPCFNDYLKSLPYPGGNGTLAWTMRKYPEETRLRIRMKSGSMTGVRCYSGYIVPRSGKKEDTVVFSVMVNNFTAKPESIQSFFDTLIGLLAEFS